MELNNTKKLLNQKFRNGDFDSYGILVSVNGTSEFLHSQNVDENTYFDIASMGKVLVTSTLALMAIDRKKFTLTSTLKDFFENVPEDKTNITVMQLLTHTSGIIRYEIPSDAAKNGSSSVRDFILATPLSFAPGTSQIYSCNGMILLGYILEKVYNLPLEDIFNKMIKTPLEYTRSKFNIEIDEPNSVICYRSKNLDGLAHPWDDENIRILGTSAGSGGQFFTIGDINKFAKAVMNKSPILYSNDMFEASEKNYVGSLGEGWGLGWLFVDENYNQAGKLFPVGSFGHCGHTGTSIFFNRNHNIYVIILTNATRCLNKKNNFKGYDYNLIENMRQDIHNTIYDDLNAQGLVIK